MAALSSKCIRYYHGTLSAGVPVGAARLPAEWWRHGLQRRHGDRHRLGNHQLPGAFCQRPQGGGCAGMWIVPMTVPGHRVILLSRGSMFAFQWREFSPLLSSAHRLLQCYHSQWEIGEAAIPGEFPLIPPATSVISQWESSLEWRHAVTLNILVGKICISFFLFYCEGMLSLVVLWLCVPAGSFYTS